MVSRISCSSGNRSGSNFPAIRGNYVPKLNLQFSQKELSIDEKKLFRSFRKGQIKSAPLSLKTRNEGLTTSAVALERQVKIPGYGKLFGKDTKEDTRNGTPKTRMKERNAAKIKDCREYVKNYTNARILGSGKERENVLLAKRREKYEKKNTEVKIPLQFTGDVIEARGDIHFCPRTSSKSLFIYKKNFNKPTREGKREIRGIIPRHQTCLPVQEDFSFVRPDPKYLYRSEQRIVHEDEENDGAMNSSFIWEQHVLSLVSKTTAQWIANQCSVGEQRERLICFLDEFYDEREPGVSGAGSVRKLVDIDDDCITVPRKRNDKKRITRENCRNY